MIEDPEDDVERFRKVRRGIEREFGSIARLGAFLRRKEKSRVRNIAMGRKLLGQLNAPKTKVTNGERPGNSRRSA